MKTLPKLGWTACIGAIVAIVTQSAAQPAATNAARPAARYVEGELLVRFRDGPRGDVAARAKAAMKHGVKRHFDFIGWQQIKLPAGMTVEDALTRYRNLPSVLAAEPNIVLEHATATVPNDLRFPQQYALGRIAAPTAWEVSTGSSNVVVALLDSGINYRHEDLYENVWRNPGEIPGNGIDDDGNGFVDDVFGIDAVDEDSDPMDVKTRDVGFHGTAVAGIIGGVGNNVVGVAGVNWSVRLMALRITDTNNTENIADQLQALNYVLLMKRRGVNLRVLNLSYGSSAYSQAAKDAHDRVAAEGIIQVAAAGNASRDMDPVPVYPAAYAISNLIAVAASTPMDELAYFSNFGRNNVDLAAPGALVLTADGSDTNGYLSFGGTSAAVPHVVGTAALLAAAYPTLPAAQIRAAILESVDVLPAFLNRTVTGGRLNVGRALYQADPVTNALPGIVLEPRSQTVLEDSEVQFTVITSGTEPFRYRWQFNDADLPGATNAVLPFPNVVANQAGSYAVVISNAFGMVTSSVATLTVLIDTNPVFIRITNALTLVAGDAIGSVWADCDNDGDNDLFVPRGLGGENDLFFRNNGDGTFTNLAASILARDNSDSRSGAWADYDNDGDLDLLVANAAGQSEFLYRNEGRTNFIRLNSAQAGPIVNSPETNSLYRNEGGGVFSRVNAGELVTEPGLGRGGAWGDYDNDGDLDLYVCRVGRNMLFRNDGHGAFTRINSGPLVNDDFGTGAGSNAAVWGDYDNDGWLDLFVATGGGIPHLLFHNEGDGSFRKITSSIVAKDSRSSAGCSWLDYDNDGQLDLFVTGLFGQTCLLYRNHGNTNACLKVKCAGVLSNRSGIGAKVRVLAKIGGTNRWQMREISGGGGFGSQLQLVAHFGLADATIVDTVRVEWPSGTVQELTNIPANQFLTLTEPGLGITREPQDVAVRLGASTNFTVAAVSDQPPEALTYQWLSNGVALAGQTAAELPIANAQLSLEAGYSVIVSDGVRAATSRVARLVVLVTPTIPQPPLSQAVVEGGSVTFSVGIAGWPAPFTYEWRKGSAGIVTNTHSLAADFLTLTNVPSSAAGNYRVVVKNAASPSGVAGAVAVLTVLADADHNGLPDVWELAYGLTVPDADADGDGASNRDEYLAGTNPTNALDSLRVDWIGHTPDGVTLEFIAVSNLTYTVEHTASLGVGAWSKLVNVVARPTNRVETLLDPSAEARRYYRLVTPRQP